MTLEIRRTLLHVETIMVDGGRAAEVPLKADQPSPCPVPSGQGKCRFSPVPQASWQA